MSVTSQLREKLMIGLRPTRLDVINESEMHAGHRSSPGTGESHFRILVVSEAFAGKSRVERHRLVLLRTAVRRRGRILGPGCIRDRFPGIIPDDPHILNLAPNGKQDGEH